jgi:hypothetical protein
MPMDFDICRTKQPKTCQQGLLKILDSNEPIWKDEDHPELAEGPAAWVDELRREGKRFIDDW